MHDERIIAVAAAEPAARIVGIELYANSHEYGWRSDTMAPFEKRSLFAGDRRGRHSRVTLAYRVVRSCWAVRARHVFMCGHGTPGIFLASLALRLIGTRVYAMTDSKYDDMPRRLPKEIAKAAYYRLFSGAIVASSRAADYLRFLGFGRRPIVFDYDNRSVAAIRQAIGDVAQPVFADRPFVCIARLVPKKNHSLLLRAFAHYAAEQRASPRRLVLCGSGALEDELRALAETLGIAELVDFRGWEDETVVARTLSQGLCLVLASREEQFGIAVIEALAAGRPVIVTEPVGARDCFVRTAREGFVVEPDNVEGLAFFMALLGRDEALWRTMCGHALATATRTDASAFARSAWSLIHAGHETPSTRDIGSSMA
ncbi:glycosyltransferase [Sphingomonas sp. MA1305]|uniref:glycosyltransferase n=1 Tax=Sphingomonas sp. MA1305 TaxID=2479204 RepID=UPI0018DF6F0D|nr:glycosyltransferase [Sphingomonas sp. MA1305]MBI0477192.1 glycosyltransferase [Sphingomonas sp. MA1305]